VKVKRAVSAYKGRADLPSTPKTSTTETDRATSRPVKLPACSSERTADNRSQALPGDSYAEPVIVSFSRGRTRQRLASRFGDAATKAK
jgi:hypothetical protein